MLKELIKLADHLDAKGFVKEADHLDRIIKESQDKDNLGTTKTAQLDTSQTLGVIRGLYKDMHTFMVGTRGATRQVIGMKTLERYGELPSEMSQSYQAAADEVISAANNLEREGFNIYQFIKKSLEERFRDLDGSTPVDIHPWKEGHLGV
jgi:hypothetical protein